jgi:hypothetical protein
MRALPLFLVLFSCFCWSQSPSEASPAQPQCCACTNQSTEDNNDHTILCLSERQMRSHLLHVVPLELGEQHVKMSGTLVMQIRFQPDGTVGCAKAISGHPLAVAWAMQVVPKWTFRAVTKKQKKYGGCGLVRVKYNMSDSKQETSVQ